MVVRYCIKCEGEFATTSNDDAVVDLVYKYLEPHHTETFLLTQILLERGPKCVKTHEREKLLCFLYIILSMRQRKNIVQKCI
jgi:hypothetical protein